MRNQTGNADGAEGRHGRELPAGETTSRQLLEETHLCRNQQKPEISAAVLAGIHHPLPPCATEVLYILQLIAEKDGFDLQFIA